MYQSLSDKKASLYLNALSPLCSEDDLVRVFSRFGDIIDVSLKRPSENSSSLRFGFVNFMSEKSAHLAKAEMNGYMLHGEPLRIGWASVRIQKQPKSPAPVDLKRRIRTCQLHISYISEQIDFMVTSETLRDMFSAFGNVLEVSVVQSRVYTKDLPHRQCGHGFIHYTTSKRGIEAAFNAVQATSRQTIDGVVYDCELSHQIRGFLTQEKLLEKNPETGEETLLLENLSRIQSLGTGLESTSAETSGDDSGGEGNGHRRVRSSDLIVWESDDDDDTSTINTIQTRSTTTGTSPSHHRGVSGFVGSVGGGRGGGRCFTQPYFHHGQGGRPPQYLQLHREGNHNVNRQPTTTARVVPYGNNNNHHPYSPYIQQTTTPQWDLEQQRQAEAAYALYCQEYYAQQQLYLAQMQQYQQQHQHQQSAVGYSYQPQSCGQPLSVQGTHAVSPTSVCHTHGSTAVNYPQFAGAAANHAYTPILTVVVVPSNGSSVTSTST